MGAELTVVCVQCLWAWKYLNYACRHLPFPKFLHYYFSHFLCFLSHMHDVNPIWYPLVTIFSSVWKVLSVQNRTLPGLPCARWAYCYAVLWLLHWVTVCMPYLQCCVYVCICCVWCVCCVMCCVPCALCVHSVCFELCVHYFGNLFGIIFRKVKVYAGHSRCHFLDFFGISML